MPTRSESRYEVTAYILFTAVMATLVGTLVGLMFDDTAASRGTVGIVAAFVVVAIEIALRRYVGQALPQFFLSDRERNAPLSVWVGAIVTAVAAGLATSNIGQAMGITDSMWIGMLAGLFAGLVTATLVVLHDHETNPHRGRRAGDLV
jgi:hypothetical protein